MDKLHELFSALQETSVKNESKSTETKKEKINESNCKIETKSESKQRLENINEARKEKVRKALSKKRKQNESIKHLLSFQDKCIKLLEKKNLEKKVLHDKCESDDNEMQEQTDEILAKKDRLRKLNVRADKKVDAKLDKKEEALIRRRLTDGVL